MIRFVTLTIKLSNTLVLRYTVLILALMLAGPRGALLYPKLAWATSGSPFYRGANARSKSFSCEMTFTLSSSETSNEDQTPHAESQEIRIKKYYDRYFSKKIKKELSFEKLLQQLRNSPAHQRLWAEWLEAKRNLERLGSTAQTHPDPYVKKMLTAAHSAVEKHFAIFFARLGSASEAEASDPKQDMARFLEILKTIQIINEPFKKADLYRLQKLITQRYDLMQFIDCRN